MTLPLIPIALLWCAQAAKLERVPLEWNAMRQLFKREVGTYNPTSRHTTHRNPKSTARGLGQLLKSTAKNVGIPWDTNDPVLQLRGMYRYIHARYGSAAKALAHHKRRRFY